MNIVKLYATTSTNDELRSRFRESELTHLTTVVAYKQSAGKGQHGAKWHSEPGKNLTFSFLLDNSKVRLTPFQINKWITVSLVSWLKNHLGIKADIKWPNDILAVNHKLAGILIETVYSGSSLSHAIVGIGLNVNQDEFPDSLKAISLKLITGKQFNLDELLFSFVQYLNVSNYEIKEFINDYNSHLYKLGRTLNFEYLDRPITATIIGVTENGLLELMTTDSQYLTADLKELKWFY
ncbi:biotin--[acetyl-CoA-carboxylase] ligase [Nonlabens sp. SCSIO 43208]|uniref:biotin--[acetyl-CoA-carboxylase] ligase n=1 Tax=Nonlabens sp. SCSIO 43208 TaxID=2793009 RepID=UPI003D6AF988